MKASFHQCTVHNETMTAQRTFEGFLSPMHTLHYLWNRCRTRRLNSCVVTEVRLQLTVARWILRNWGKFSSKRRERSHAAFPCLKCSGVRRLNKFYLNCIPNIFAIKIKNSKNCYRNNVNFTGSHNKIYFVIYAVLSSYPPPQHRGLANRPLRLGTGSVVQISQAVALVSYIFFSFCVVV